MLSQAANLGALDLGDLFYRHIGWWIIGVLALALLLVGWRDLIRVSLKRIWAISGVAFAESIRRRVLWLTPLAIIGIILVSQLQRPVDEMDAIRQTTKFCLFATGILVTIVTIILACTSLPKEIDNRVIYTVVTKPTTRLEIVLGKVLGFALVSAAILGIMGLFTWGYLNLRAWSFRQEIVGKLQTPGLVDGGLRPTLEHYRDAGLLSAKTFAMPSRLNFYSRAPQPSQNLWWISGGADAGGGAEQDCLIPFDLEPGDLVPGGSEGQPAGSQGLIILLSLDYERQPLTAAELAQLPDEEPATPPVMGPALPGTPAAAPPAKRIPPPLVQLSILGPNQNVVIPGTQINNGKPIALPPKSSGRAIEAIVPPNAAMALAQDTKTRIYVELDGPTEKTNYAVRPDSVTLIVPGATANTFKEIHPATDEPITFRGHNGPRGQQLRGTSGQQAPVAVFSFHNATPRQASDGLVPFELRSSVERNNGDTPDEDQTTHLLLEVHNPHAEQVAQTVDVESGRTTFFNLPAASLAGGDFDVFVYCHSDGQWLGLYSDAMSMVRGNDSFGYNLAKSLLVMWLLSILVIIVAIFCSTFLSWPIAVVLTAVILLGHWGVEELGDATTAGIGNQVATDFGFRDPARAKVVSESVEAMTHLLNVVSTVLPDISQFSATEDIEKGVTIPHQRIWDALQVIGCFGIPMTVLAYIFLKNKEVAP